MSASSVCLLGFEVRLTLSHQLVLELVIIPNKGVLRVLTGIGETDLFLPRFYVPEMVRIRGRAHQDPTSQIRKGT